MFNRLYQASGDAVLGEAARRWYREVLKMRRDDMPLGGIWYWRLDAPDAPSSGRAISDRSFLEGAGGVALALFAAQDAVEPAWDRLLLLS
jgi:hypothetical protein